jgi:hypothetical protein
MKKIFAVILAAALLSACAGGTGSGVPTASNVNASPTQMSTVTFTLTIPPQSAAAERRAAYVSWSTVSAIVSLTAQNGNPVSPAQLYALDVQNVNVCHPVITSVARLPRAQRGQLAQAGCHITIPAPVGTDTFTVSTYDAHQTSSTPTTATGNMLSTGTVSTVVVLNAANSVSLTTNGVVAAVNLILAHSTIAESASTLIGLVVQPRDADNNTIIGPGNFQTPIVLTDSDTSGATSLTPRTTLTNYGDCNGISVQYNGSALTSATFTASINSTVVGTATLTLTPTPTPTPD